LARPFRVTVKGVGNLRKRFGGIIGELDDDTIREALLEGAKPVAEAIEREAPRGPTGKLKTSVGEVEGSRAPVVFVAIERKDAPYAKFVERGKKGQAPNPFFKRGVARSRRLARAIVQKKLGIKLKRAVRRRK
jgi:HK97 gp10 family phage protein